MKFYNRETELAVLRETEKQSRSSAQMTFVVGRRRIGKTSLLYHAFEKTEHLYLFVAKKNEALLCEEFVEEIKKKLDVPVFGELRTFRDVFGMLMELSRTRSFTLIIDEFQELMSVNPSTYSEMQNIWDTAKNSSHINLILCGSIYSLMIRIFQNSREPLFGRATHRIHLKALNVITLRQIMHDYRADDLPENMLAFYLFTGGVPKYVELLAQVQAFSLGAILNEIFAENSLFIEEGRNVLVEEFGKDYGNYFSILSLIASGKTARPEIESMMGIQVGGFLDRLENEYGLIRKVRPLLAKPNSRSVKFKINDNFLNFWFRYIYKNRSAVEISNFTFLKDVVRKDYPTYSGHILEKYYTEELKLSGKFNRIGTYWEKQNQNEIDIVAINDKDKQIVFVEVKRNPDKINIPVLQQKSQNIQRQFSGYRFEFKGLSLSDISHSPTFDSV